MKSYPNKKFKILSFKLFDSCKVKQNSDESGTFNLSHNSTANNAPISYTELLSRERHDITPTSPLERDSINYTPSPGTQTQRRYKNGPLPPAPEPIRPLLTPHNVQKKKKQHIQQKKNKREKNHRNTFIKGINVNEPPFLTENDVKKKLNELNELNNLKLNNLNTRAPTLIQP